MVRVSKHSSVKFRKSLCLTGLLVLFQLQGASAEQLNGNVSETEFKGIGNTQDLSAASQGNHQLPSWFGVADPSAQQQSGLKNQSPVPESETALPGQISQQQTSLQGSVVEDNQRHGNLYLINSKGLILWRIIVHPKNVLFKRGDRILALDGYPYSHHLVRSLPYDTKINFLIKRKDGTVEQRVDYRYHLIDLIR